MSCPTESTSTAVDDEFWSSDGIHWDAHRIGWAVAGGCAALTTLITLFTVTMHATRYKHPPAQRQVIRVLLMPPVYAIVSFFSYRYYREYEYYILAETAYEAVTLSAFLMLLMELVSMGTTDLQIKSALAEKDKMKFPFPFNFWRFRASKPYFWHALSFSVMQYVVLRPLISIIGIICQYYGVLCPEEYSVHFAEVYLDAVDFVSISVALYGLIVFYVLCKDELKGKKPLNKFLAIKLIVFFTFYQSFLFSILQSHGVIKATELWTATNVSDGLSALCTCVEMVFFSIYMGWAYNWTDYTDPAKNPYQRETGWKTYFQAIWDTINLSDFAMEVYLACKFFVDYIRGVPGTHSSSTKLQRTFMPDTIPDYNTQEMTKMNANNYGSDLPADGTGAVDPFAASGKVNSYDSAPQSRRTPSDVGFHSGSLRSPNSYQRLEEGAYASPERKGWEQGQGYAQGENGVAYGQQEQGQDGVAYGQQPQAQNGVAYGQNAQHGQTYGQQPQAQVQGQSGQAAGSVAMAPTLSGASAYTNMTYHTAEQGAAPSYHEHVQGEQAYGQQGHGGQGYREELYGGSYAAGAETEEGRAVWPEARPYGEPGKAQTPTQTQVQGQGQRDPYAPEGQGQGQYPENPRLY